MPGKDNNRLWRYCIPTSEAFFRYPMACMSLRFCRASCSYSCILLTEPGSTRLAESGISIVSSGSPSMIFILTIVTFRLFSTSARVNSIFAVCNNAFSLSLRASRPFFSRLAKSASRDLDWARFSWITRRFALALYKLLNASMVFNITASLS